MPGQGFGAFGKIPAIGDFFRIQAPSGFVSVWDNWLQRCMVSGAHTFGSRWDGLYMSVPIWRFSLSSGLAGSQRIIGVLMPSVDRVGRRFPLTLMAPMPDHGATFGDHLENSELFCDLEEIALDALDDTASRDALEASLADLTNPKTSGYSSIGTRVVAIQGEQDQAQLITDIAVRLSNSKMPSLSVWSAIVDGEQRMMLCEGLPEGPNMQGLFDLDAPIWTEG